jgi:hypothetical protein
VNLDGNVAFHVGYAHRVRLVVDHRRAGLHGGDGVEDRRQHFVFHLDQVERGLGDLGRFGGDDGDAVAHVAHLVVERNLVPRVRVRPRLPARGVDDARDVLVGEHGMDARQRPRLAGVDARDAGVGVGAGEQRRVQHAGHVHVVGKDRLALDQLDRIHLHLRAAHHVGGGLRVHGGEGEESDLGLVTTSLPGPGSSGSGDVRIASKKPSTGMPPGASMGGPASPRSIAAARSTASTGLT